MNSNTIPASAASPTRPRPHRVLRWTLLALAIWITLIGLFYTEENWRGKRAWEACKREAKAKGRELDWPKLIPPPVPDDQNFFKARNMQQWFTGRGGNTLSGKLAFSNFGAWLQQRSLNTVAEVTVVPVAAQVDPATADIVLQYKGSNAFVISDESSGTAPKPSNHAVSDQLNILISTAVAEEANGSGGQSCDAGAGFKLVNGPLGPIKPVRVVLKSDAALRSDQINACFPAIDFAKPILPSRVSVRSTDNSSFVVSLSSPPYVTAASYLEWSDPLQPDLEDVRAALKRPYARMDGNYQSPQTIPIPNFVCCRAVAQMLSGARAVLYAFGSAGKSVARTAAGP